MWWVASRTCSTTPTWNTSTSACPAKRSAQPPSPIRRSTHRESRLTLVLSGHTRPFGVKGSGVFFGNRVFKLMRRWPKKIPDPVRLRPTAALRGDATNSKISTREVCRMAFNDPLFDDLEPLTDDLEPLTEGFDPLLGEA